MIILRKLRLEASFFLIVVLFSCIQNKEHTPVCVEEGFDIIQDTLITLTELQPCDILVKPNLNWIPGTSMVMGGRGFGHAVIVVEGASGDDTIEVLQKAKVFESQARDVSPEYQLRIVEAYKQGSDFRYDNINFDEEHRGYRYRLRFPLTEEQKKALLDFVLNQDEDVSCWRSMKKNSNGDEKSTWYCSLLIWQAFYSVLGIDLDENGGWMVFPNDLISSPYFDNDELNKEKRVRF